MLGKNAEKELLANMEEIRYMTRSIVRKSAIFAKYMDIEDFYQEAYIEYLPCLQRIWWHCLAPNRLRS